MASCGWLMKINFLRGFLLSASQHGNKPPSRHEAKSLKRHAYYTDPKHFLTRNIHSRCWLASDIFQVSPCSHQHSRCQRKIGYNPLQRTDEYDIGIMLPPEFQLAPNSPCKENYPVDQNAEPQYAEQNLINSARWITPCDNQRYQSAADLACKITWRILPFRCSQSND